MALAMAYSRSPQRQYHDHLVISHFDAHGIATAAALARKLQKEGRSIHIIARYPDTGPQGFTTDFVNNVLQRHSAATIDVIDIPINVRNPEATLAALRQLASQAKTIYYDHHETDKPFIPRLVDAGVIPVVADTATSLAAAMGLFADSDVRDLAVVGIVADRDSSIVNVVDRSEVEQRYLPLANRLDVIVRNPRLLGAETPGDVAMMLASYGISVLERASVDYPPERLALELQSRIQEEGNIAILVDWSDADQRVSQWVPKTLEQLLLLRRRYIAVAVVPGYNPRTRSIEGYDVRILKYWLAPSDVPSPESVAKDLIAAKALTGNVVGHGDYISIRFGSVEEARAAARRIYNTIEGAEPTVTHLVNDRYVAAAVRRDYQAILAKLTEILDEMRRMYSEYLELKRRQVELLERASNSDRDRTRYD